MNSKVMIFILSNLQSNIVILFWIWSESLILDKFNIKFSGRQKYMDLSLMKLWVIAQCVPLNHDGVWSLKEKLTHVTLSLTSISQTSNNKRWAQEDHAKWQI